MPKGKRTKNLGDSTEVAVEQLIAFANLDLSRQVWDARKAKPRGSVWQLKLDWLLWRVDGRRAGTGLGFKEAKQLQREVREALAGITRDDPRPLTKHFDRAGSFRYAVWTEPVVGKGRKSTQKTWRFARIPTGTKYARQLVTINLVDTLPFANRLGQCSHCKRFFLSQRARPQRFCTERCSTEFHNKRRLASGYFTEKRRKQRAAKKQESLPAP